MNGKKKDFSCLGMNTQQPAKLRTKILSAIIKMYILSKRTRREYFPVIQIDYFPHQ